MLINGRKKVGIKTLKNPKTFTIYSQTIDDIYENLEDGNPTKKRKVFIVFDEIVTDMKSNETLSTIVAEFFLRGRKLNIYLLFLS